LQVCKKHVLWLEMIHKGKRDLGLLEKGVDFVAILKGHPWPLLCLEYRSDKKEHELDEALAYLNPI